ncbi:MAG: NADH-quinone oxidoreductase subunit M [Planctomycetota bacterium]
MLLTLPVVWAVGLLLPIPGLQRKRYAWAYSAVTSAISLTLAIVVAMNFDWTRPGDMQLSGSIDWIPSMGLSFRYGVDAISLWLILLTAVIMPVVVLSSLIEVDHDMRQFHFWLHILEAALIGTFVAQDIVLFYVCFEFTLIPLYFLIGVFGHKEKLKAARVYFLYAFTGSMLTFAGVLYVGYVGWQQNGIWTFAISDLYEIGRRMSMTEQCLVFAAMLAGFGVKTPLVPFHTWLPLAHTEAPTAGSVDLAGLVLKLGPYGLIRLAIPMLPDAALAFAPWVCVVAVIGILYAALICRAQKDAKRLVAYSSVSHMGFVALGLFVFDPGGIAATGAVFYMLAHGLATGGLFLCIGMLYDRFHTREFGRVGGTAKFMPVWSFFFMMFVLASVGLPGLNGFPGEFLTLMGAFDSELWWSKPMAVAGALGVILAAVYLLYMAGRMVWGTPIIPPDHAGYLEGAEHGVDPNHRHDLSWREITTLVPVAALCLMLGLLPMPVLRTLEAPVVGLNEPVMALVEAEERAALRVAGDEAGDRSQATGLNGVGTGAGRGAGEGSQAIPLRVVSADGVGGEGVIGDE